MATVVKIGSTSDDPRVINKSVTWTYENVSCNVIHSNPIYHPSLELEYKSDYDSCNYMYIEEFHRYYYIEDITMNSAKTCVIVGHSDPLMSFKEELQSRNFTIARKENANESYIFDDQLTFPTNSETTNLLFSGNIAYSSGRNYVLLKLK